MILSRDGLGFAGAVMALAVGCATPKDPVPPPVHDHAMDPSPQVGLPGSAQAPTPSAEPATSATLPNAPAPTSLASAAAPAPSAAGPYATFFAALRELEAKRRAGHVRVMWLGDSHGMADFWSGQLRTELQKRFGAAGPGFVHLGLAAYRHDGVKTEAPGKWKTRPKGPATAVAESDGIFGLGGMMVSGYTDAPKATIATTDGALKGKVAFDVCYRLEAGEELAVDLPGTPRTLVKETATEPAGKLAHLTLLGDPGATLTVTPTRGSPELCGVAIETDPSTHPGVVLDTVGINGARFLTALAWDETAWGAEWKRRSPELVVLEYGTNELSDITTAPAVFTKHLANLVGRLRRYRADVSCLVLAPTDRLDREEIEPALVTALEEQAKALGCGFWNTFAAMGGKGSIDAWRAETPPRAAKDGIHLTWKGYREMGSKLFADLMKGY